jgi:hypothetical protein
VGNDRPVHTNVVVVTEVEEFLPRELGAVIGDDRVGYAKAVDDVSEEGYRLLGADVDDRRASIHLENLSTTTSGPTMSRCQMAKGHVMGMVWSACAMR